MTVPLVLTAPFCEVSCKFEGVLHWAFKYDRSIGVVLTDPVAVMGMVAVSATGLATPPIVQVFATVPVTVKVWLEALVVTTPARVVVKTSRRRLSPAYRLRQASPV